MIIANKTDNESHRVVSEEQGKLYATNHGFLYSEISAKTGKGLKEALETLSRAKYIVALEED